MLPRTTYLYVSQIAIRELWWTPTTVSYMWLTIVAGSTAMPLEGGALIVMHGRSRMTIDHCTPTMPGRSTPSFHRPGRDCLHQALQSAVRCSASRMKDELHPTTVRTVCGGYVRAQVRLTGVNHVKTLEGHNLSTSTCNPGNDLPLYSLLACMAGRLQFWELSIRTKPKWRPTVFVRPKRQLSIRRIISPCLFACLFAYAVFRIICVSIVHRLGLHRFSGS